MVADWRHDIQAYEMHDDFEPFYRDFCALVAKVCFGFAPSAFGVNAWDSETLSDLSHEILVVAFSKNLWERLIGGVKAYSNYQWQNYFKSIVRNHLLKKLPDGTTQTVDPGPSLGDEDTAFDQMLLEQVADQLLSILTVRQRKVLREICIGQTLEQVARKIGAIKKSMVHLEKTAILSILKRAKIPPGTEDAFVKILCELAARK